MRLRAMAQLVGVALLLVAEVGAAASPTTVLGQLDTEPAPNAASVTRMIRVSLDADARAPLSKQAVARYIRPSLDANVAASPLAPLPQRKLRPTLDAAPVLVPAPEASSWFDDARTAVSAERSGTTAPVLRDTWPLAAEASAPPPKRRIRIDLSSAPVQIATPLPARRLRLQLD